jgi:hypothetical protein
MKTYVLLTRLFVIVITHSSLAATRHVPDTYSTIQTAINAAVDGDTVLVADGLYYENIRFKGKGITVASTFLMDHDTTHILNTIIDGSKPTNPDSASVVCFVNDEDTTSILVGFTLRGGSGTVRAKTLVPFNRHGGAIFCSFAGATIRHNRIINNRVEAYNLAGGGGIFTWTYARNCHHVIIEDNYFSSNTVVGEKTGCGGAILNYTSLCLRRNVFKDNHAVANRTVYGGAVAAYNYSYCKSSQILLEENQFIENSVTSLDSLNAAANVFVSAGNVQIKKNEFIRNTVSCGPNGYGSGLYLTKCGTSSSVCGNLFSGNSFTRGGLLGGGLCIKDNLAVEIASNHFIRNEAEFGGAMALIKAKAIIGMNWVQNNKAARTGGGIAVISSPDVHINNCIISENSSPLGGGLGVWKISIQSSLQHFGFQAHVHELDGYTEAELYAQPESIGCVVLSNNTIYGNKGDNGSGLCVDLQNTCLINSIVYGNQNPSEEIFDSGDYLSIYASVIPKKWDTTGEGNIIADPQLLFPSLKLKDSSPCIGAGLKFLVINDSTLNCCGQDCMGSLRPNPAGSNPDIGAFEHEYGKADITGALVTENVTPTAFLLSQNYPNPFNPNTTIEYSLPQPGVVKISIYNSFGQHVHTLVDKQQNAGTYSQLWDANDAAGTKVSSGVYIYRIEFTDNTGRETWRQERTMLLLK